MGLAGRETTARPTSDAASRALQLPKYPGHVAVGVLLLAIIALLVYVAPSHATALWTAAMRPRPIPSEIGTSGRPASHVALPGEPPRIIFVVTSIGAEYNAKRQPCRETQLNYTGRNGYDFIVVTQWGGSHGNVLPFNYTSPWFQKYVSVTDAWAQEYDYLVAIDGDFCISGAAPPIHPLFPALGDRIGAVNEFKSEWADTIKKFGWDLPYTYYKHVGFNFSESLPAILNSGLVVWQPRKHAKLVEAFISKYGETSVTHKRGPHYEQGVFGGWAISEGLWAGPPGIPSMWNALWIGQRFFGGGGSPADYVAHNHFIHLCAGDIWTVGDEFARQCMALGPPPPVPATPSVPSPPP